MRLESVRIVNFRSIRDVTIDFSSRCRVLVGINESGKSNILRALSLLDADTFPIGQEDRREKLPDEEKITEAFIRFEFELDKTDLTELLERFLTKIACSSKESKIVRSSDDQLSLREISKSVVRTTLKVDLLAKDITWEYQIEWENDELIEGWCKPTKVVPASVAVNLRNTEVTLAKCKLAQRGDLPENLDNCLEAASLADVVNYFRQTLEGMLDDLRPEVLKWEYSEANLLPNEVPVDQFAEDPSSCVPLKNMFALAGHDDIPSEIERELKGSLNSQQNFLNSIADKTTKHFRDVWKEYGGIEFSLQLNGNKIVPGVREHNTLDFGKRSDGFKRFVTFLLLISTQVKTRNIVNALLLIDEPEISLHPSGARYLRDELIRISKHNLVVYSTHSVFMIDPDELGRHYIVKKASEITSISAAAEDNLITEEVLHQALGHSAYRLLKSNNLVFEGWRDKKLYSVALKAASAETKKKLKDVGVCHSKGAKSIQHFAPILELAERRCLIITDNDATAKQKQKEHKKSKGFGAWKTYADVNSQIQAVTGEDFLSNAYIAEHVNRVGQSLSLPNFEANLLPAASGKLDRISNWLRQNGLEAEELKATLESIKDSLFDTLEAKHITADYQLLLDNIEF